MLCKGEMYMKHDSKTKENLLAAAKEEFLEKGYTQASLRSICKRAGVTTGALYFFFQDKEDLFASLVTKPLEQLHELMQQHYEEELKELDNPDSRKDVSIDQEAARMAIEYLYEYHDEFLLVLTKAQGSRFETYLDDIISVTEQHYRRLADEMSKRGQISHMEDGLIHWFSHLQVNSFAYLITHGLTKEEGEKQIRQCIQFMIQGFMGFYSEKQ